MKGREHRDKIKIHKTEQQQKDDCKGRLDQRKTVSDDITIIKPCICTKADEQKHISVVTKEKKITDLKGAFLVL